MDYLIKMEKNITLEELQFISLEFREKSLNLLTTSFEYGMSRLNKLIKFIEQTPILYDEYVQKQTLLDNYEGKFGYESTRKLFDYITHEGNDEQEISFFYQFFKYALSKNNYRDYFDIAGQFISPLDCNDSRIQSLVDRFHKNIVNPHFISHINSYLKRLIIMHEDNIKRDENRKINAQYYYEQNGNFAIGNNQGKIEIKDHAKISGASQDTSNSQSIDKNQGNIQTITTAGEVNNIKQNVSQEEGERITQQEAIELLTKIEELINTANLPSEIVNEATKYVVKAKEEAEEEQPQKSIIISQLDRATNTIKKVDSSVTAISELTTKLKPLFSKLALWLHLALEHFNLF